jgi:hypothetical protein
MTATATHGSVSRPRPGYLNGGTPHDQGLSRKSTRRNPELSSSVAGAVAPMPGEVPFGFVPDLQRLAGAMGVWQGSWMASYRAAELLYAAMGAASSAQLVRAQEAAERAVAAGRAMAEASDRAARVELAWAFLQDGLDRGFADALTSLDRTARLAQDLLELAGDRAVPEEAIDRAA